MAERSRIDGHGIVGGWVPALLVTHYLVYPVLCKSWTDAADA
jgi:hypothetical protein